MPKDTSHQTFEKQLAVLVEKFRKGRDEYMHASYPEAQARTDFINPLFEALGWDVSNAAGLNRKERQVNVEQGETIGNPDYNFRVDGRTVFFVEAKAPHVSLENSRVILQAKKYAYNETSEKVFLAAATDFEEFRFYEVRDISYLRHVNKGLIFEHRYDDYLTPQGLADLWQISHEAVLAGSLDKLITPAARRDRQRIPLDQQFLSDLTDWREKLAKAVFKAHPELHAADLNSVVQVFLDRLIFIRVAEDRGVLARQLLDIAQSWKQYKSRPITAELLPLFRVVNQTLNGEIFKEHPCEKIDWDSALVAEIIEDGLEPYNFAQIGVELLGSIYERYLGKTIRVTETRAIVEDKPEVRKAGGVYYTPKYIVDYIVAQTVGKLIEGKTPKQIEKLRVLDPACGSGSFLLGAYQTLLDYHTRYYAERSEKRTDKAQPRLLDEREGGEFRLSLEDKAAILRNNIYGVDIDPQAVEITMMSLYIKMLEGERGAITGQGVLPRLRDNIKCGNSLIGYDIGDLSGDERARINPFDWNSKSEGFGEIMAAGGFDAVIGNPPYITYSLGRGRTKHDSGEIEYIARRYSDSSEYKINSFAVFYERGLQLCNSVGLCAFIVPGTILINHALSKIRHHFLTKGTLIKVVSLNYRVFADAEMGDTAILVVQNKRKPQYKIEFEQYTSDNWSLSSPFLSKVDMDTVVAFPEYRLYVNPFTYHVLKIGASKNFQTLGEIAKFYNGIKTGDNKRFISDNKASQKHTLVIRGRDFDRYTSATPIKFVYFDPRELWSNTDVNKLGVKGKIIIRQTGDRLTATIDPDGMLCMDTVHMIYEASVDFKFLLGLLNSRFLNFYHSRLVPETGKAFAEVKIVNLQKLPIPIVSSDPTDKSRHDKMVTLVERMLDLHKQKQAAKSDAVRERIEREIHVTDEQIDVLVYELYGLTKEEITVVEGKSQKG